VRNQPGTAKLLELYKHKRPRDPNSSFEKELMGPNEDVFKKVQQCRKWEVLTGCNHVRLKQLMKMMSCPIKNSSGQRQWRLGEVWGRRRKSQPTSTTTSGSTTPLQTRRRRSLHFSGHASAAGGNVLEKGLLRLISMLLPAAKPALAPLVRLALNGKSGLALKKLLSAFDKGIDLKFRNDVIQMYRALLNKFLLTIGINPCQVECQCRGWLAGLVDPEYKLVVRLNNLPSTKQRTDPEYGFLQQGKNLRKYFIAKLMHSSMDVSKFGEAVHKIYRDAADAKLIGCTRKPSGDCVLGTQTRKFVLTKTHRETGKRACELTIDYRLDICAKCCCPEGLVKIDIATELTFQNATSCQTWFSFLDSSIRATLSLFKSAYIIAKKNRCLDSALI